MSATCVHGYIQLTCPTCNGRRSGASFAYRPEVPAPGATTPGHDEARGTLDLNDVIARASARVARDSRVQAYRPPVSDDPALD